MVGYTAAKTARPRLEIVVSTGANWMAENARSWSSLISVSVAKSASTARLGTTTDTSVSLLMASAAVMSKTDWPIAKANVRHTMGSSRNNNKRGVKVVAAHWTTRNSSEKITATTPSNPSPRATSISLT